MLLGFVLQLTFLFCFSSSCLVLVLSTKIHKQFKNKGQTTEQQFHIFILLFIYIVHQRSSFSLSFLSSHSPLSHSTFSLRFFAIISSLHSLYYLLRFSLHFLPLLSLYTCYFSIFSIFLFILVDLET